MQRGGTADQGVSERGSIESGRFNPRAAESPARRSELSGERGSKARGLRDLERDLERGQAMTAERSRDITGARGQAIVGERGRAMSSERGFAITGERSQPMTGQRLRSRQLETTGPATARGSTRDAELGLTAQQRTRLGDMLSARRDIPRVSNVDLDVRVNARVPKSVRLAPVPKEVARILPRFRGDRVFIYRDEIVIVDPATSRIVAVLPT